MYLPRCAVNFLLLTQINFLCSMMHCGWSFSTIPDPNLSISRISYSKQSQRGLETKKLKTWSISDYRNSFIDDLIRENVGASFYDPALRNYSQMVLVPKQSVLYVVGNDITLLKLKMSDLYRLDSFTLPPPMQHSTTCPNWNVCKQSKEISLLALLPNEKMIWVCYVHRVHYPSRLPQLIANSCMVPKTDKLSEALINWNSPHFSSLDPKQSASVLNANDSFTYISSFAPDYVRIVRTRMPGWNGNLNWTGSLLTDKSPNVISEPASIILTFETEHEVYFLLREQYSMNPMNCNSHDRNTQQENTQSSIARLIRICKGDQGGISPLTLDKFGTISKADLQCQAADQTGTHFRYTEVNNAFWDNQTERLYAIFHTEKWAPTGSAICVYNKQNIEAAFNGPLLVQNKAQSCSRPTARQNSFPNICQRFNSKEHTSEELTLEKRMLLTFPYRFNPIKPLYGRAIAMETGVIWNQLQTYDLSLLKSKSNKMYDYSTRVTILWLTAKSHLTRLALYEATDHGDDSDPFNVAVVCKLNQIYLGSNIQLLKRSQRTTFRSKPKKSRRSLFTVSYRNKRGGEIHLSRFPDESESKSEMDTIEEINQLNIHAQRMYISTSRQILWLPLTDCSVYETLPACMESREPHCGWYWKEGKCINGQELTDNGIKSDWLNHYTPSVDLRSPSYAECPTEHINNIMKKKAWSAWYPCPWKFSEQRVKPGQKVLSFIEKNSRKFQKTASGSCRCRICLNDHDCTLGMQEVTNCTRFEWNWLPWTVWSPCASSGETQTRNRVCKTGANCVGVSKETRPCSFNPVWSEKLQAFPEASFRNEEQNAPDFFSTDLSPTTIPRGYDLNYVILVSAGCTLIGIIITVVAFGCLYPCCFKESLFLSRYPIKKNTSSCISSKNIESSANNKLINSITNEIHSDEHWGKRPGDTEKHEGYPKQGNQYDSLPRLNPPISKFNRKGCIQLGLGSSTNRLLPSPEPSSMLSSPSTASTMVKDKRFTFDSVSDANLLTNEQFNIPQTLENVLISADQVGSCYPLSKSIQRQSVDQTSQIFDPSMQQQRWQSEIFSPLLPDEKEHPNYVCNTRLHPSEKHPWGRAHP